MIDNRSPRFREEHRRILSDRLKEIGRLVEYDARLIARVWRLSGFLYAMAMIDAWADNGTNPGKVP